MRLTHWSHESDWFHPFAERIRSAEARCRHLDKESGNWKNNPMFSAHALDDLVPRPDGAVIILLKSFNN